MPVRVSQQQQPTSNNLSSSSHTTTTTTTTTTTYSLRRESPASSRGDDSSTSSISLGMNGHRRAARGKDEGGISNNVASSRAADGRQRKRLHKTNPEPHNLPRKPSLREPRSPPKNQRVQRHDQKPMNKTLQFPNSSSDNVSTNALANNTNPRTFLQPPGHAGSNVTTFYAFGQNLQNSQPPPLGEPFDFSPAGDLENVHRGIIDTEQLSQFPTPGRGRGNMDKGREHEQEENHHHQRVSAVENSSRPSVLRRPSVSNKLGGGAQGQGGYEPRNRRQSTAPTHQSSNTSLSSTYRKNMTANAETESSKRRRPSVATNSLTPPVPQKDYIPGSGYSKTADGVFKVPASNRNAKSKSLQPPPRQAPQAKPSLSPEHGRAQSIALPPKSPRSPNMSKLNTPQKGIMPLSGSSRRISTIPHASGLGARTVSPTDARRLADEDFGSVEYSIYSNFNFDSGGKPSFGFAFEKYCNP